MCRQWTKNPQTLGFPIYANPNSHNPNSPWLNSAKSSLEKKRVFSIIWENWKKHIKEWFFFLWWHGQCVKQVKLKDTVVNCRQKQRPQRMQRRNNLWSETHIFFISIGFLFRSKQIPNPKKLKLAPKMFWCSLCWVPEPPCAATTLWPIRTCHVANHGIFGTPLSLTSGV